MRELDPLPDVPSRMEPLGPVAQRSGRVTHEKSMLALYPVRDLRPGERPRDWMDSELAVLASTEAASTEQAATASTDGTSDEPAPARSESGPVTGPQRYKVQFTATLRCRAHNALAAEEDFGRAFVEQKRTTRHESFSRAATDAKADSG